MRTYISCACLMDEVFGRENAVSSITFKKTSSASSELLSGVCDYLLWYSKNKSHIKYRQIYFEKTVGGLGGDQYAFIELPDGTRKRMTNSDELSTAPDGSRAFRYSDMTSQRPPGDFPVLVEGRTFRPARGYWKTGEAGYEEVNSGKAASTACWKHSLLHPLHRRFPGLPSHEHLG